MMQTVGIDAVDIKRIHDARDLGRVAEYILRDEEREEMYSSRDRAQFLASRLAMKEAVIKAFPEPLTLQDVRISGYGKRPVVQVDHPRAGGCRIDVSLTHTFELAIAVACVGQH